MDSPLPVACPWTPPETDIESSPRSDYFSDPFRRPHYGCSSDVENRWPPSPSRPDTPAQMEPRCDTPTEAYSQPRPKPVERVTEPAPYTPTKSLYYGNANATGALRYPYTPDSSRILRRSTELPSSPSPWDDYSENSSSPVQNALSSCIAHFENLIQSQQPNEDQMEYIVGQFEALTAYLSAPDAQTRKTDDHLFSDPEPSANTGLCITDAGDGRMTRNDYVSREAHDAYISEVGSYLDGIKKYIEDLKMRFDEVKTLNSIQLDVINDLRRQMKTVRRDMRNSLDMGDDAKLVEEELERIAHAEKRNNDGNDDQKEFGLDSWETLVDGDRSLDYPGLNESTPIPKQSSRPTSRVVTIIHKPHKRSFWASVGDALDTFGNAFLEY